MRSGHIGLTCVALLLVAPTVGAARPDGTLIEEVKAGNITVVRTLIEQGADVNAPDATGTTALHWAAELGEGAIAELLLDVGADAQAANRYGVTPIMSASSVGDAAIIDMLLQSGADPNTASPDGETVLMTAARTGRTDAVRVLLAHGANVNAREAWRGQTALMWAAAENHGAAGRMLIEAGAEVDARTPGGFSALLFAVRAGQTDAVEALLVAGADVNDTIQPPSAESASGTLPDGSRPRPSRDEGASALMIAVGNAHYELAAFLLDQGADPNADGQGWTALHQIAWDRRPPIVKGLPPAVPTGSLDSLDMTRALLAHGADPNARQKLESRAGGRLYMMSRIGATPFFNAAKGTDLELMKVLVEHGADPLLPNEEGATPFMAAAGVGIWKVGENAGSNAEALEAVKFAWELGSEVNVVDAKGNTALHGASIRGANAIVQFLVENGAQIDVRNEVGWTPLTVAEGVLWPNTYSRWPDTASLLRQLGASDPGQRRPEDLPPAEVFNAATEQR